MLRASFPGGWVRPDVKVGIEVTVENDGADLIGARATGSCQFFRTLSPTGSQVLRRDEKWTWGCPATLPGDQVLDVSVSFVATDSTTGRPIPPQQRALRLVVSHPDVEAPDPGRYWPGPSDG